MQGDTALDRASFWVEELKYGPGEKTVEQITMDEYAAQMEVLLRAANVTSTTGEELLEASKFYAVSQAKSFGVNVILTYSIWLDGLMHGVALTAGLEGTRERLNELEKEGEVNDT